MKHLTGKASGNELWFTPPYITEAAREVMGSIDLDPASCKKADTLVKARHFFDINDNGLENEWWGNVFLNPPYSRRTINLFCSKVREEYTSDRIDQAVVLVNNATEQSWFQELIACSASFCLPTWPTRRVAFISGETMKAVRGNNRGQAIFYLGERVKRFAEVFSSLGPILVVQKPFSDSIL